LPVPYFGLAFIVIPHFGIILFSLISGSALTGFVLKFLRSEFPKVVSSELRKIAISFLFGNFSPSFRIASCNSNPPCGSKKTEEKFQVPEGRFKKIAKNRNYSFGMFSWREEFLRVRHNKIFLRGIEGEKRVCKLSLFLLSDEFCFPVF
jgi:hypothetical protein